MNVRPVRRAPRPATVAVALLLAGLPAAAPGLAQSADAPPPPLEPRGRLPQLKPDAQPSFEMVLIHGLGGAAREWDGLVPYLVGTFKVGQFELAGHGRTQPVPDPTVESEARRLGEYLRQSGLSYPTLVGHGLGGMVALQYALDHPGEIHRLILIDTAPRQLANDEQKLDVGRRLMEDYDRFVGERYSLMSPDDEISQHILDMALRTHAATFVSLLMSSFDFDLTARLRTLSVPLLVIGSELMFPDPDQTQPMLAAYGFDQARSLSFKRFGRTGHYIMLEQPVMLASVLMAYGVTAGYQFQH
ncbi:alpha/beta hydrolase [bacterium]|nr:alpha/beta hydrolase [bacterium]